MKNAQDDSQAAEQEAVAVVATEAAPAAEGAAPVEGTESAAPAEGSAPAAEAVPAEPEVRFLPILRRSYFGIMLFALFSLLTGISHTVEPVVNFQR